MTMTRTGLLCGLLLCAVASAAFGQTCQNTNGVAIENPPGNPEMELLRFDDAAGVDCEIDLFVGGLDAFGNRSVAPPPGYTEVYTQETPVEYGIRALGRELAIDGTVSLPQLTIYRLMLDHVSGLPADQQVLDFVLLREFAGTTRLSLLQRRPNLAPQTLASVRYGSTVPCTRGPATGCVRTFWEKTATGARLRIELSSSEKKVVDLAFGSSYAAAPRLAFGYVEGSRSSTLTGWLDLLHRVCYAARKSGSIAYAECDPRVSLKAEFNQLHAKPGEILNLRVDVSHLMPYELAPSVELGIDEAAYVGHGFNGWSCGHSDDRTRLVCSTGATRGSLPNLLVQFRAPEVTGQHLVPVTLKWYERELGAAYPAIDVMD